MSCSESTTLAWRLPFGHAAVFYPSRDSPGQLTSAQHSAVSGQKGWHWWLLSAQSKSAGISIFVVFFFLTNVISLTHSGCSSGNKESVYCSKLSYYAPGDIWTFDFALLVFILWPPVSTNKTSAGHSVYWGYLISVKQGKTIEEGRGR